MLDLLAKRLEDACVNRTPIMVIIETSSIKTSSTMIPETYEIDDDIYISNDNDVHHLAITDIKYEELSDEFLFRYEDGERASILFI